MADEPFVGGAAAAVLFGIHGDQIIPRHCDRLAAGYDQCGSADDGTRVLLAMGRDGLFAHQATRVNAGGTPTTALLLSTVVTGAFLFSGTFGAVLGVIALLLAVNYLLMFISLIVLRIREPNTPRPYRAWGYPWTPASRSSLDSPFIVGVALSDPHHSAIALAILLVSYPLFRGTRRLLQYKP